MHIRLLSCCVASSLAVLLVHRWALAEDAPASHPNEPPPPALHLTGTHMPFEALARMQLPPPRVQPPPTDSTSQALCIAGETAGWGDRTVADHTFIFPAYQQSAFVATYFGIQQGFSAQTVPNIPAGNRAYSLKTLAVTEQFDLGVKLTDWIGVNAAGTGMASAGVNAASMLLKGATYAYGGSVGAVVRIARIKETKTQISARVGIGYLGGQNVNLAMMTESVIAAAKQNPKLALSDLLAGNFVQDLFIPFSANTFSGSVHGAQTLSRHFGLQATAGIAYTKASYSAFDHATNATGDFAATTLAPNLGFAFTADAAPSGVPIAGLLDYTISFANTKTDAFGGTAKSDTTNKSQIFALGAFYSGRRDLQLGIVVATNVGLEPVKGKDANGNPADSDQPHEAHGKFVFRYMW